jgi:hypothetical protein
VRLREAVEIAVQRGRHGDGSVIYRGSWMAVLVRFTYASSCDICRGNSSN